MLGFFILFAIGLTWAIGALVNADWSSSSSGYTMNDLKRDIQKDREKIRRGNMQMRRKFR